MPEMARLAGLTRSRIIEPLASRCSKFRFRPLAQGSSQARIEMIAQAEGVQTEDGVSILHLPERAVTDHLRCCS